MHCPTCREPARLSDLGRMFVEIVVLDEATEYKTRLVRTIDSNSTFRAILILMFFWFLFGIYSRTKVVYVTDD